MHACTCSHPHFLSDSHLTPSLLCSNVLYSQMCCEPSRVLCSAHLQEHERHGHGRPRPHPQRRLPLRGSRYAKCSLFLLSLSRFLSLSCLSFSFCPLFSLCLTLSLVIYSALSLSPFRVVLSFCVSLLLLSLYFSPWSLSRISACLFNSLFFLLICFVE